MSLKEIFLGQSTLIIVNRLSTVGEIQLNRSSLKYNYENISNTFISLQGSDTDRAADQLLHI